MVGCPFDGLGSFIDLNDYRRPASRLSKQCVVMAGTGVSSPDQSRPAHGVEKVAWKSALTAGRSRQPATRLSLADRCGVSGWPALTSLAVTVRTTASVTSSTLSPSTRPT